MAQKTHPLGFRYGIKAEYVELGYTNEDLHGINARWAINKSGSSYNYSSLSQKDNLIRTLLNNLLEEEGFIRNKFIIHRADSFVGIYIDAYEIEENLIVEKETNKDNDLQGLTGFRDDTTELENYISKYIEGGKPVSIQFVQLCLKEEGSIVNRVESSALDESTSLGLIEKSEDKEKDIDLDNCIERLFKDNIPCCNLIAKVVSYKIANGSRGERGTLRLLVKNMKSQFEGKQNTYGVKGYLIVVKGRIGGSERSRIVRFREGPMPRHTVSAGIDYGFSEVSTVSGRISLTIRAYFSK